MKKTTLWIILAAIAVLVFICYQTYNGLVTKDEAVNTEWANVETQYQRRADLIPNLVNTVKGYAAHEQTTFEQVVEARTKATSINLTAADLTEEKMAEFQKAQAAVRSSLGRLIAIAEQYPDLKANQNFLELQAQLEGTENRIAVTRSKFNEVTKIYNVAIRRFPSNILASLFGFSQKPYFAADEGTDAAPQVTF
ncbi:MAG: LemA family protein [Alistipes sp.]